MATGTVKWFNATKSFGFIQPDAGGTDVFVHISAVERVGMRDLNEGQKIAYEVVAEALVRTGLTPHNLPADCSNDRADECSTWTNSSKAAISIAK